MIGELTVIDLIDSDEDCVDVTPSPALANAIEYSVARHVVVDLEKTVPGVPEPSQMTTFFDLSCEDEDVSEVSAVHRVLQDTSRSCNVADDWDCNDDTPILLTNMRNATPQNSLSRDLTEMGFEQFEIRYAMARCNSVESAIPLIMRLRDNEDKDTESSTDRCLSCPICMDECPVETMVTLSCLHRLCTDCFNGFCSSKISDGEVSAAELCCPALNPLTNSICKTPISIHEIKAHVPEDIFDKYQRFQTRAFCEKQKMRSCPKCNEWYIDITEALFDDRVWCKIVCGNCSHAFCGKCGLQPHKLQSDQDISCQALADWMEENNKSDTSLSDYMKEKQLFPCPSCRMATEHSSGCKFLYCLCRCTFCALCGQKLTEKEHFSHFQGVPDATGPYGMKCQGMDKKAAVTAASSSAQAAAVPPAAPAIAPAVQPVAPPAARGRKRRRR
jgi:hypothetical protein